MDVYGDRVEAPCFGWRRSSGGTIGRTPVPGTSPQPSWVFLSWCCSHSRSSSSRRVCLVRVNSAPVVWSASRRARRPQCSTLQRRLLPQESDLLRRRRAATQARDVANVDAVREHEPQDGVAEQSPNDLDRHRADPCDLTHLVARSAGQRPKARRSARGSLRCTSMTASHQWHRAPAAPSRSPRRRGTPRGSPGLAGRGEQLVDDRVERHVDLGEILGCRLQQVKAVSVGVRRARRPDEPIVSFARIRIAWVWPADSAPDRAAAAVASSAPSCRPVSTCARAAAGVVPVRFAKRVPRRRRRRRLVGRRRREPRRQQRLHRGAHRLDRRRVT